MTRALNIAPIPHPQAPLLPHWIVPVEYIITTLRLPIMNFLHTEVRKPHPLTPHITYHYDTYFLTTSLLIGAQML